MGYYLGEQPSPPRRPDERAKVELRFDEGRVASLQRELRVRYEIGGGGKRGVHADPTRALEKVREGRERGGGKAREGGGSFSPRRSTVERPRRSRLPRAAAASSHESRRRRVKAMQGVRRQWKAYEGDGRLWAHQLAPASSQSLPLQTSSPPAHQAARALTPSTARRG